MTSEDVSLSEDVSSSESTVSLESAAESVTEISPEAPSEESEEISEPVSEVSESAKDVSELKSAADDRHGVPVIMAAEIMRDSSCFVLFFIDIPPCIYICV